MLALAIASLQGISSDRLQKTAKLLTFMKVHTASYITSATTLESCPDSDFPEFAFIGRSNVGKSSLLNLITNKEALAKVSGTPGHTQLINFFLINEAWSLVDLPGYGYATKLRVERARFEEMISNYLSKRTNLARVFVLIDSRHTPQTIDLEFVEWLSQCGVPAALVFTKIDKAKPREVQKNITLFCEKIQAHYPELPPVFKTSSETGAGRMELLGYIEQVLALSQ
jgi:GTP-binding protein